MDSDLIKTIGKALVVMWNSESDFKYKFYDGGIDENTFNYLDDLMLDLTFNLSDEINDEIKQRHYYFGHEGNPFEF